MHTVSASGKAINQGYLILRNLGRKIPPENGENFLPLSQFFNQKNFPIISYLLLNSLASHANKIQESMRI